MINSVLLKLTHDNEFAAILVNMAKENTFLLILHQFLLLHVTSSQPITDQQQHQPITDQQQQQHTSFDQFQIGGSISDNPTSTEIYVAEWGVPEPSAFEHIGYGRHVIYHFLFFFSLTIFELKYKKVPYVFRTHYRV